MGTVSNAHDVNHLSPSGIFKGRQLPRTPPMKGNASCDTSHSNETNQTTYDTPTVLSEKCENLSSTFVCTPSINIYHPVLVPDSKSICREPKNYIPKGREIQRTPPKLMLAQKVCAEKETTEILQDVLTSEKSDSRSITPLGSCRDNIESVVIYDEIQPTSTNVIPKGKQLMRTPPKSCHIQETSTMDVKTENVGDVPLPVNQQVSFNKPSIESIQNNFIPKGKQLMRTPPSNTSVTFSTPCQMKKIPDEVERTPKLLYVDVGSHKSKFQSSIKKTISKCKPALNSVAGNPLRKHLYKKKRSSAEKGDFKSLKAKTISERKHSFEQEIVDELVGRFSNEKMKRSAFSMKGICKAEVKDEVFQSPEFMSQKGNFVPRGNELARTPPSSVTCAVLKREHIDTSYIQSNVQYNEIDEAGSKRNTSVKNEVITKDQEHESVGTSFSESGENDNNKIIYNSNQRTESNSVLSNKTVINALGNGSSASSAVVCENNLKVAGTSTDNISVDKQLTNANSTNPHYTKETNCMESTGTSISSFVNESTPVCSSSGSASIPTNEKILNIEEEQLHKQQESMTDRSYAGMQSNQQNPAANINQACQDMSSLNITPTSQRSLHMTSSSSKREGTYSFSLPEIPSGVTNDATEKETDNYETTFNLEEKLKRVNLDKFDSPYQRFAQRGGRSGKGKFQFSLNLESSPSQNTMSTVEAKTCMETKKKPETMNKRKLARLETIILNQASAMEAKCSGDEVNKEEIAGTRQTMDGSVTDLPSCPPMDRSQDLSIGVQDGQSLTQEDSKEQECQIKEPSSSEAVQKSPDVNHMTLADSELNGRELIEEDSNKQGSAEFACSRGTGAEEPKSHDINNGDLQSSTNDHRGKYDLKNMSDDSNGMEMRSEVVQKKEKILKGERKEALIKKNIKENKPVSVAANKQEVMQVPRRRGRRKVEEESAVQEQTNSIVSSGSIPKFDDRTSQRIPGKTSEQSSRLKITEKRSQDQNCVEELPKARSRRKAMGSKATEHTESKSVNTEGNCDEGNKDGRKRQVVRSKKLVGEKENIPEKIIEELPKTRGRKKVGQQEAMVGNVQESKLEQTERGSMRNADRDSISKVQAVDLAAVDLPKRRGRRKIEEEKPNLNSNDKATNLEAASSGTRKTVKFKTDGQMKPNRAAQSETVETTAKEVQVKTVKNKDVGKRSDKRSALVNSKTIELSGEVVAVDGRKKRDVKKEPKQTSKAPTIPKSKEAKSANKSTAPSETVRRSSRIAGKTKFHGREEYVESTAEVIFREIMTVFYVGLAVFLIINYQQEI